jgi:hypothetical protein
VVCLHDREGENLSRQVRMVTGIGQAGMTFTPLLTPTTRRPPRPTASFPAELGRRVGT